MSIAPILPTLIRRFRGTRSKTQYARALRLSKTTIYKYESGLMVPSLTAAGRMIQDAGLCRRDALEFLWLLVEHAIQEDHAATPALMDFDSV